jgi:hypothetical protein
MPWQLRLACEFSLQGKGSWPDRVGMFPLAKMSQDFVYDVLGFDASFYPDSSSAFNLTTRFRPSALAVYKASSQRFITFL